MRTRPVYEYLIFNGRSSLEFRTRISGGGTYKSPQRDISTIEVPGRNGTLTLDNGRYTNVQETYEAFITEDFDANLTALRNFLQQDSEYHRLSDTYHPDEFRMARFIGPIEPDVRFNEAGSFDLTFDRMPQRWLTSGESPTAVTSAEAVTLYNPTNQTALPKIVVTSGTGTIRINDVTMVLTANNGATVIDTEMQDAYEGAANRNNQLTLSSGVFPALAPGNNSIDVSSGMTIEIYPRWWRL